MEPALIKQYCRLITERASVMESVLKLLHFTKEETCVAAKARNPGLLPLGVPCLWVAGPEGVSVLHYFLRESVLVSKSGDLKCVYILSPLTNKTSLCEIS